MNIRIVTASAGSGKTYRLTKELAEATASGRTRPEGIVAVTFTNQAAAELIERARSRLLADGRPMDAHRLLAARIGTVNAVCGGLVADFAFELGLSPALRVLDEPAAELEFRRALAAVATPAQVAELERLRRGFDQNIDWTVEVRRIVEAARSNGLDEKALEAFARRSIQDLEACLGPRTADDLDAQLARALDRASTAIRGNGDDTKVTAKYLDLVDEAARELARARLPWGTWAKLAHDVPGKKSAAAAVPVSEVAARHIEHPRLHEDLARFITIIFELAEQALAAYQAHKRDRGVIDFVDQETLALELLRRDDVRQALAGQIDLFLVDEFQDTSPIQLAVFLELAALARESIWVGDPKQAIFGFRGTDPALMDAAIESLTSTTTDGDLVEQAARVLARGTLDTLDKSYRSRPALVKLTSELYARAFASQGMPEERTRLEPALAKEPRGLGEIVEYWPLIGKNAELRADAVATGVRDLLARGTPIRARDESVRPATRGDVAVLCRTNKQCQAVADALAAIGVPAVVPRMGLLDTLEAIVALAGLALWADGRDALAAAELARLISYAEDLDGLVARALETPGRAAFEAEPAVVAVLAARAAMPDLGPVAALDVVIDATELRRLCAEWGDAAQRLANLDALRAHAVAYVERATSGGDAATLFGLLAYLTDLAAEGSWQKQRTDKQAVRTGEDAVTISTWHRAKGLEWPITVLFGLESLAETHSHGVHVLTDRTEFEVNDPLGGRWIRYWPNPYTNAIQKGVVRDAFERWPAHAVLVDCAAREALRVLYVGWTRARDRLVLAAAPGKLLAGIVGMLARVEPGLISEPRSKDRGVVPQGWAGTKVDVLVVPCAPTEPAELAPVPGTISLGRTPEPRAAARAIPSEAQPMPCSIGEVITLGPRVSLAGRPDMELVGNAVHAFLAADRPGLSEGERTAMAKELLASFGLAAHLELAELLALAGRFWSWVAGRFEGGRLRREWPVARRTREGTIVAGTADLVIEMPHSFVLVDHKTFPGEAAVALERAKSYSGQLAAYAGAISAAVGAPAASTWIHFPVLGVVVEVRPEG